MHAEIADYSIGQLIDHIGRNDAGRFYGQDYSELAAVKQRERDRVGAFMLPYFPNMRRLKILSMPGTSWAFEHAMIAARPGSHVVGVESSITVFHQSRRAMPERSLLDCKKPGWVEHQGDKIIGLSNRTFRYGRASYTYARTSANFGEGKEVSAHRLLMMRMSTYASMLVTDYGQFPDERRYFHKRFCSRNSAWLDFTGSMSAEIENSLRHLPLCLVNDRQPKPVVVTLFNGHDDYRGPEQRIARLRQVQPLFIPVKHWTYAGKNNSPMLTVCGTIT